MEKSTYVGLGIFVAIVIGGLLFISGGNEPSTTGNAVNIPSNVPGDIIEVTTTIQGLQYNPDTINLNEGDTVRLTVINKDNFVHAFNLKQFGITGSLQPNSQKTVEFVATKTNGQAVYTCSQEHGETLTFIIS